MASTNKERWDRHQQRRREGFIVCVSVPVHQVVLERLKRCNRVPEDFTPEELGEAICDVALARGLEAA